MSLITDAAKPWTEGPEETAEYRDYMWAGVLTKKRQVTKVIRYEWTCDAGGAAQSSGAGTDYVLMWSGFVPDPKFRRVGLPTPPAPAGVWREVWMLTSKWYRKDGSSWILIEGQP